MWRPPLVVVIADPRVADMFHDAVYGRDPMMVQALRNDVGDEDGSSTHGWRRTLRPATGNTEGVHDSRWAGVRGGPRCFFQTWLFTPREAAGVGGANGMGDVTVS